MSSPLMYRVPEGMSCVNVLYVLWSKAKPFAFFEDSSPRTLWFLEERFRNPEKIASLFQEKCLFFGVEGGRKIDTDFSKFPEIRVDLYNEEYGQGAAQKIIERYNENVSSADRFDEGDSYRFEFRDNCLLFRQKGKKLETDCSNFLKKKPRIDLYKEEFDEEIEQKTLKVDNIKTSKVPNIFSKFQHLFS
jgi:hypothetical protein